MLHETRPRSRRAEVRRRAARLLVPFVLLLGLFTAGPLQAQPAPSPVPLTAPDTLFHEQWTVEDGLPVNHANALHQTPDGYIWLATFDGLVRFDGLRFTVYNASNTPALPSSRIAMLFPGRGASFWLGTEQGTLVRVTDGRFERVASADASLWLWDIYPEPDGPTWIGTQQGLYRYEAGRLTPAFDDVLGHFAVTDVLRDRRGTLWVATRRNGVWRANGDRLRRSAPGPEVGVGLAEDAGGTLWAGGQGVARYRAGRWEPFAPGGASWTQPNWAPDYAVWDFHQTADGSLWMATTRGLYRTVGTPARDVAPLPGAGTILQQVPDKENFARCPGGTLWLRQANQLFREGEPVDSVSSDITDVLCDRAGNVWVTTQRDGLHRYGRQSLRTIGEQERLGFRNAYTVYQDRAGALWFGGASGTVSRLNEGTFRHYTAGTHFRGGIYESSHALYEDRAGNVWLGFQVCRAQDRTADGHCTRFDWVEGARRSNGVYAIHQTTDGALWFGTTDGLYRLHENAWTRFTTADGLPDDHVRFLLEARDGTLYAATLRGGVLRYDGSRFSAITTADGLPSNHVRALHEDEDGFLWIGTEDRGLARYDPATGALATIRQADGLYYDGIHQILEDAAGRLWMSTNRGLFWVRRAALNAFIRGEAGQVTSVPYTERDGMRNREANGGRQQSALKASDGRLWFATQAGAVVVDPADVPRDTPSPQPIIEQVTADGAPLEARTNGSVALAADERSFTVAYTAPAFSAPERLHFRYQLDGFDDGWVDAGSRREATYTKVPPGSYTFRVAALRPGGEWVENAAALRLTVAPFFYETWWFPGLCGAAFGLVLLGGYRARTRHLRRRQEQLQAKVDEQTRALRTEKDKLRHEKQKTERQAERLREMDRLKSRFFANVSHEFRTPLTLMMGPLEDLQSGEAPALPSVAQEKVDLALRNSRRLLRLIGQLLDVAKLEAGEMRLDAQRADLAAFVRRCARSFVPLAERRRVRFIAATPETSLPACFDPEKMEQVLANLLSNAFKFTPEGGTVRVTASVTESSDEPVALVTVRDTGPGISPDDVPHLFKRFYQAKETHAEVQPGTGIGLSLAKDLTELHGGTITVDSTVGSGTAFTVHLPRGLPAEDTGAPSPVTSLLLAPGPDAEGPSGDGAAPRTPSAQPEAPPATADRTTLLIADDNAEIRAYVRGHFAPRYRIIEADEGKDALDMAREHLPDCIISDVMMPHRDGFELVQALHADRATDFLPVLLLTARATDADKIQGLDEGADAYLTKPFNMRELQARVENLIASRQRLKERFAAEAPARPALPSSDLPEDLSPSKVAYLRRARAAVEAHLSDEDFGVKELAAALDQSRSTLYRRLRDLLEQSPTAFIRTTRLEQAAALLRDKQGTVSEVAYAVGFKSISHFSQTFREQYGVSPSAYQDAVLQ